MDGNRFTLIRRSGSIFETKPSSTALIWDREAGVRAMKMLTIAAAAGVALAMVLATHRPILGRTKAAMGGGIPIATMVNPDMNEEHTRKSIVAEDVRLSENGVTESTKKRSSASAVLDLSTDTIGIECSAVARCLM
ncbi:hypothetical protein AJ87_16260 [Rhizobium yanglingense]|nr:hypothetical protein AJ87_16260 [Rhizobium yanglingense]